MQTMRWMAVIGVAAALAATSSFAQAQTAPAADATKPATKAADKKAAPEKKTAADRKAAPEKKAPAQKKPAPKKEAPKKAAPKKTDADAKKPTTYSTKQMELRDEKGNIIPTNPDAYDVSSALPGKTPPKKK